MSRKINVKLKFKSDRKHELNSSIGILRSVHDSAHLRQLLGLTPLQVEDLQFHELAALVYRDNIYMKHGDRTRLLKELDVKKQPEMTVRKARTKALADQAKASPDLMSGIILEHLHTVSRLNTVP